MSCGAPENKIQGERNVAVRYATIGSGEGRIKRMKGTINVAMTISLCKGRYPAMLHKIQKPVTVT